MSIRTMCRGDLVFINTATMQESDYSGKRVPSWSSDSGDGVQCRIETLSASETKKYQANGIVATHNAYFATDPSLEVNTTRLHWTKTAGKRVTVDKILRVTGVFEENNPRGTKRLFVIACNYEEARKDA